MSDSRKTAPAVTTANDVPALSADAVRWRCNPESLPFDSTAELEPSDVVIGQQDAIEALHFGLETNAPGQNIFVRGLAGTGRMTLLKRLMEEIRPSCPLAMDRCYVHNFPQPDRPRLITLPRGRAESFRKRIDQLVNFIRKELVHALSSDRLKERRASLDASAEAKYDGLVKPLNESLEQAGMQLVTLSSGPIIQTALFPLYEGKPVAPEKFEQLRAEGKIKEEDYQLVQSKREEFAHQLQDLAEQINDLRHEHEENVQNLMEQAAGELLHGRTARIAAEYDEEPVKLFLSELVDDVVKNRLPDVEGDSSFAENYRVNVVLSHTGGTECPIVLENTPTLQNLLGGVDYHFDPEGEARATHLGIRAGSILRADGGYLVLDARDVLMSAGAWPMLIRTLRTSKLEITPQERAYFFPGPMLKPEPIDVHVKVILLGDSEMYYILDSYDPDFAQLFKVLADFDSTIPRDGDGASQYASVLARIAKEESLPAFDRTAIAALVEHGARIASRKGKLTARFGRLADVAREAAFVAGKGNAKLVTAAHVTQAIRQAKRRADLPARKFREYLADGTIRVQTSGAVVGQINGLAVLSAGPLTYGFPARITSTIGPGTAGVINIEREANLSGAIHTKGFYILGGLLRWLLQTEHPLAFDASIAFEQSYGGIDGDSASGAEICCLLSALTGVPLRQDLAMTGAIDQVGHIQPIGAVNEKIEGFFDACHDIELTSTQGVIIPKANAGDLMLREDVVEACRAGKFHVYAVNRVHEALHILTGRQVGERQSDGTYPEGSVLRLACQRARDFWRRAAEGRGKAPGTSDVESTTERSPRAPSDVGGADAPAAEL